ncbi:MAG: hypothetical protein KGJ37_05480 [Verrucomicrobiota bacterium]|nr:hypothetical protein [Verrucomicrobiota bacterium]
MFSAQEMMLMRHKRHVCARIARERSNCLAAVEGLARPLRPLDRIHASWRATPAMLKFAAVPLAVLAKRKFFPKKKSMLPTVTRWIPLALKLARFM